MGVFWNKDGCNFVKIASIETVLIDLNNFYKKMAKLSPNSPDYLSKITLKLFITQLPCCNFNIIVF